MEIAFCGDWHLYHHKLREERGFKTLDDMHDAIATKTNEAVPRNSALFNLGDICFSNIENLKLFLRRLNCKNIHFIIGNHDYKRFIKRKKKREEFSSLFASVNETLLRRFDGLNVYMAHYAHRVWPMMKHKSLHLFAHSHNRLPPYGLSFDVGIDTHDLRPYLLHEIKERYNQLNFVGE